MDGKVVAAGMFERIVLPQLPDWYPRFFVVLRIGGDAADSAEHHAEIRVVDADGRVLVKVSGPFRVDPGRADFQLVLELNKVRFEKAGPYVVDILMDGRYEDSLPFEVVQGEPPGTRG